MQALLVVASMIIPTVMGQEYEFTSTTMDTINWDEVDSFKMNIYQAIVKRIDNSSVTISPIVYGLKTSQGSPVDAEKWMINSNGIFHKKPWAYALDTFEFYTVTATYENWTLPLEEIITVEILPEPLIIKPSANIENINENSGPNQLLYTAVAEWEGGESLSRTHGMLESTDATFSLGPGSDPAISIDSASGEVRLTIDPDFETKGWYSFSVKATLQDWESVPYSLSFGILDVYEQVLGCIDQNGQTNYNPLANTDDGSCIPCDYGCMDTNAYNYNATFTCPDSSCKVCDQLKINYNSNDCLGACGQKSALCEGYKTDYDTNCGCSS